MKFSELFGKAAFVTASEKCLSPVFRGTFFANKKEKTEITVVGLGFFRLFVNGQAVTCDRLMPVSTFYHDHRPLYCADRFGEEMASRIYALRFDLTDLVTAGENELAAVVGPGWYAEFSDRCVLCYKIVSGDTVTVSDGSLLWADGPLTAFNMHFGESQDYTKARYDENLIPDAGAEWLPVTCTELPETEYALQDCPNDRVIRTLRPEKISDADGFAVYDAGENISGTWVFHLPRRGERVTVEVSEAVLPDGTLDLRWQHGQRADFVTDGTDRAYRLLFTWHGFRYFRIRSDAAVDAVEVVHADVPVTSEFCSENKVLNWLYETYLRTQLCNLHAGVPSDCPHIERRGYTGDGQLTCETGMLLFDSKRFYRKWIGDISDCQDRRSGHVQYTAPYYPCGGGPGGWGCAIAEVPYWFYRMYGDLQPFCDTFAQSLRYLDYLDAHSENDLVVSDQPGNWCLGEWCVPCVDGDPVPAIPAPFVNNYFYIRTCDRLLELAEKVGRADAIPRLKAARKTRADAIIRHYFDPATGDFAENKNSANAFALDLGLGDARTLEHLVAHAQNDLPDTGIFGYDLLVKQLFAHGYFDAAVDYLSREAYPSFGDMMHAGATTLWETWEPPRSMSHPMFGSVTKYLFYEILGIRQKPGTVGFSEIVIAPHPNARTGRIRGAVRTPKGIVRVEADPRTNTAKITVPAGLPYAVEYDGEVTVTVQPAP